MKDLIAFFGVRRNGNHAIQEWIAQCYREPVSLYNDMKFPLKDDWVTLTSKIRSIGGGGPMDGYPIIVSFEDCEPQLIEGFDAHVAVIRDPYNSFASRLCATTPTILKDRLKNFDESIEAWKKYVDLPDPWIKIIYNRWVNDTSYRALIPCWGRPQLDVRSHRSSFKGDSDYMTRWKYMEITDPNWQRILHDEELRELSLSQFGWALDMNGAPIWK